MKKHWQLFLIAGLFLLAVAAIALNHRPQVETGGSYVAMDTALSGATQYATYVKTKTSPSDQEELSGFPSRIADWYGQDYDTSEMREYLEADVLLIRTYSRAEFSQPVFLLIMQSATLSSFHAPYVCYRSLGYGIESEQDDWVAVSDETWVGQTEKEELTAIDSSLPARARQELEFEPYESRVPAKRLIVFKEDDDGEIIERRLVLYTYIRDIAMTIDRIGLMRVSALIPLSGQYDDTLMAAKELMGEVVPLMFEPVEEAKMYITSLTELGAGGYTAIVLILLTPLAVIVYALSAGMRTRRDSRAATPVNEENSREEAGAPD